MSLALMLDTETTGNGPDDEIIEIGLVMLDAPSLNELGRLSIIINPSAEQHAAMMRNDVVRRMHETNGLLNDLSNHKGVDKFTADRTICKWLDQFASSRTHIPYGGSGVSHFDRKYIDRDLPGLAKRLTYWAYDVSPVRRIFALRGATTHSLDGKTHRAIDDALVHADELRFYAEAGTLADKYRGLEK